jgi:F-type H+-transporting ATPase subunit delta
LTVKFLSLVVQKRRLFAVREMIKGFRTLTARHRGEVRAEVTVAEAISDANLSAIKDALREAAAKEIKLDVRVDPAMLGGLKVKLGSRMFDASLKSKLNSIRIAMKEAR